MKKILVCLNIILLLTLCSCFPTYVFTNNFSNKVLKECGIKDFIEPVEATNIEATSNSTIQFETTEEGFMKNVSNIYDYLKGKEFKYFGFRGECLDSLFGAMPTYAFYLSTSLEDHILVNEYTGFKNENNYIFVWSNEINEGKILIDDVELSVNYSDNICTMEIDYSGNTLSSFKYLENRNYTVGFFYPWLETEPREINSIKVEWIEQDIKTLVRYNDEYIISCFLSSSYLIKKYEGYVNDINVIKCEYEMKDGNIYTINCIDSYLLINGEYYVHIENYDFGFKHLRAPSYREYTFLDESIYEIKSYYSGKIMSFKINGITYIPIERISTQRIYSIDTFYGNISIYDEDIFELDGEFYKIISDNNFKSLFSK